MCGVAEEYELALEPPRDAIHVEEGPYFERGGVGHVEEGLHLGAE